MEGKCSPEQHLYLSILFLSGGGEADRYQLNRLRFPPVLLVCPVPLSLPNPSDYCTTRLQYHEILVHYDISTFRE